MAAGWWNLSAISPEGATLAELNDAPPSSEMLPLLPEDSYLLVGNTEPPRFVRSDDEPLVIIPAPDSAPAPDHPAAAAASVNGA